MFGAPKCILSATGIEIGGRRDDRSPFDRTQAALRDPGFDLIKIPHHASRSQIETARKLTELRQRKDGTVGQRNNELELMPPDHSRQTGEDRSGLRIAGSLSSSVILVRQHHHACAMRSFCHGFLL